MEVSVKINNTLFKLNASGAKELFTELAEIHEVFGEHKCGLCGSTDVCQAHRVVDGNDFYEYKCRKCGSRLSMGQTKKDGKLFPIRQLTPEGKPSRKNGTYGPHNGWTKFTGQASDD